MRKSIILRAFFLLLSILFPSHLFAHVDISAAVDKQALMKKVSGLQIPFIENKGQIKDKSVRFYANTFARTVFVTDKGAIVYNLIKKEKRTQNVEHKLILSTILCKFDKSANWDAPFQPHLPSSPAPSLMI